MTDPTSIPGLVLLNSGGLMTPGAINTREIHAAEIPAANGVANARGLAGMYRPAGPRRRRRRVPLLDEATLAEASRVAVGHVACDAVIGHPDPVRPRLHEVDGQPRRTAAIESSVLLSEDAFGHAGMGGSLGFADPGARMSFGYTMNKQGGGLGMNDRGQALVDAVYRALGYRQPAGGGLWF